MATVYEILNALSAEEDMFEIDQNLRTISIPEGKDVLGVYSDGNVRRIWFRMPRMYGDVDLSDHSVSINYQNAQGSHDRYMVVDKVVEGDYIKFSWIVGRNAFTKAGQVSFNVCLRKLGEDSIVESEFNTTIHTMRVLEGLEASSDVEQTERDYVTQFINEMVDRFEDATPKRGIDYWTQADVDEIESYVDESAQRSVQQQLDSRILVMDQSEYDALTEYAAGVVYLVRQ